MSRQKTEQINKLLESQYSQFKSELNNEKPKGGLAFLTDDRKDMLAINSDPNAASNQTASNSQKITQKPVSGLAHSKKRMANPE